MPSSHCLKNPTILNRQHKCSHHLAMDLAGPKILKICAEKILQKLTDHIHIRIHLATQGGHGKAYGHLPCILVQQNEAPGPKLQYPVAYKMAISQRSQPQSSSTITNLVKGFKQPKKQKNPPVETAQFKHKQNNSSSISFREFLQPHGLLQARRRINIFQLCFW